jgi:hypothetical protein
MVRRVPSGIAAQLTPVAFRYRRIPGFAIQTQSREGLP